MDDNFSTTGSGGVETVQAVMRAMEGDGSGGDRSHGEWQMRLRSLAPHGPAPVRGPGVGDSWVGGLSFEEH